MKKLQNERGSALLLVLFLVAIVGVFSTPLLLSTNQGAANTIKGEKSEQVYYIAESGALIAQRAVIEASKHGIGFNQSNFAILVASLNGLNSFWANQTLPKPVWELFSTDANNMAIRSTATNLPGSLSSTKYIELGFFVTPGSSAASIYTDSATGIFGMEAVGPAVLPLTNGHETKLTHPTDNNPVNRNKTIPLEQYKEQFNSFVDTQMATRPLPKEPLISLEPFPVALSGNNMSVIYREPVNYDSNLNKVTVLYTLTAGTKTITNNGNNGNGYGNNGNNGNGNGYGNNGNNGNNCNGNNGHGYGYGNGNGNNGYGYDYGYGYGNNCSALSSALYTSTITISGDNETINITGDVISGADIVIACNNCLINISGNMVAKNLIHVTSSGTSIIVNGNIVSGGRAYFGGTVPILSVGKSISAIKDIYFISDLSKITVGDSMIAGTPDSGNNGIYFNNPVSAIQIGGFISSMTGIKFNTNLDNSAPPNIVGQSIIAGKDIVFNKLTSLQVGKNISSKTLVYFNNDVGTLQLLNGSIMSGGDVTFINPITDLIIAGDISGKGTVKFANINKLTMTGSGSIISDVGTIFGNGVKNMNISGSISSKGNVNFTNNLSDSKITGSIFSGGTLTLTGISKINTGSIYANDVITNYWGFDTFKVNGSFLSKGSLDFKSVVTNMTVTNFLGAIGNITFQNHTNTAGDANSKLTLGGVTTAGNISFQSWTLGGNVSYNPPGGTSSSTQPVLHFRGWQTQ